MKGRAGRGSTQHHPAGSPPTYASNPVVASDTGHPQSVCSRNIWARSSTVVARHPRTPSLKRWQKHSWSQLRAAPTTASMSSQVAWLAGTTVIGDESATI